jgi:hypothetical protein
VGGITPYQLLVTYLVVCVIVGWVATRKGRSFLGYFALALFVTPFIGLIVVAIIPKKHQPALPAETQDKQ